MSVSMRRYTLTIAAIFAVAVVVSAQADTRPIREVYHIHQGSFDVANDLHLKFWQKEDNINIVSWDVYGTSGGLPMPSSQALGWQPEPYHSRLNNLGGIPPTNDPDNGHHAVDLTWNGLNIPYCTTVDVKFEWVLSSWNTKHKEVKWTKDATPASQPVPLHGWDVDDPVYIGNGLYRHTVHLWNDDDPNNPFAMPFYLHDVKYWILDYMPSWDDLEYWTSWTDAPSVSMTLLPGTQYSYDIISTIGTTGYILGYYQGLDAVGGNMVVSDTWAHPMPEPGTLCIALLGGLALVRRRTR